MEQGRPNDTWNWRVALIGAAGTRGSLRATHRLFQTIALGAMTFFVVGCLQVGPATAAVGSAQPARMASAAAASMVATSATTPVYEVRTGEVHGLGKVLVNGQGLTLYVFAPDKRSGSSKCYGKCAQAWPPLVVPPGVSKAPAGSGVRKAMLGTTKRNDGTVEVTYNKWPLYTWVVDTGPGQATGQDLNSLGGKWYVITPRGTLITKHV